VTDKDLSRLSIDPSRRERRGADKRMVVVVTSIAFVIASSPSCSPSGTRRRVSVATAARRAPLSRRFSTRAAT